MLGLQHGSYLGAVLLPRGDLVLQETVMHEAQRNYATATLQEVIMKLPNFLPSKGAPCVNCVP